jgi:hypothetical protein
LYLSDTQLDRFNAIGVVPKEFISKNYYELQNLLEQIPRESLENNCKQIQNSAFWSRVNNSSKAFKAFFNTITETGQTDKGRERAARDFIENNPSSMYCEFAEHFKK